MRRSMSISLFVILAAAVIALVATFASGDSPRLGLDLQGGASVVLSPVGKVSNGAMAQAQNIITSRVDALGVAEPNIERQGNNILVELPGVKNGNSIIQIIGETAQLQFRPVELDSSGNELIYPGAGPAAVTAPTTTAPGSATTAPKTPSASTPGATV